MKLKSYEIVILIIAILMVALWFWWEGRDNSFDNTPKNQIKVLTNVTYTNKEENELLQSIRSSFNHQAESFIESPITPYLVSIIFDINSDSAKIEKLALDFINRIILKEDRIIGRGIRAHAELEYSSDLRVAKYTIEIATICRQNGEQGLGYNAVLKKTNNDWMLTDITYHPFSYSSFMDY